MRNDIVENNAHKHKRKICTVKNKMLMGALMLVFAFMALIGLFPASQKASAADAAFPSTKVLSLDFPSGAQSLGMAVYLYDRQDYIDQGYNPEVITPYFNGTLYLYFLPVSGTNVYNGHYVTITGATLTGTRDYYIGIQGNWYSRVSAPNGDYEISDTLYDLLVNYPNYRAYIATDISKIGRVSTEYSDNWAVFSCTNLDKNPNNETWAERVVNYSNGIGAIPRVRLSLPPDPEKEGHIFVGWYFDTGFSQKYDGRPIYDNTQLYAKFNVQTFLVTFLTGGGHIEPVRVNWGTEYTNTPIPQRIGYKFIGWTLNGEPYTGITITEHITLVAQWELYMIDVTFYVGGEIYYFVTVPAGSTLSELIPAMQTDGIIVTGMYSDINLHNSLGASTVLTSDAAVYVELGTGIDDSPNFFQRIGNWFADNWLYFPVAGGGVLVGMLTMFIVLKNKY